MTIAAFSFSTVGQLHLEWNGASRLGDILAARFTARRLLLVTDRGLSQSGLLTPIEANLTASGFHVTRFDGVVADPPEAVLMDCVTLGRAAGVDIVLGLGGGSSLDVAKLAAVLVGSSQPLEAMYGIGKVEGARLPLVQIPTTSGTGSEVTNITILTTPADTKMGVVADQLYADFVLLDAALTTGLPPIHTAATGIDAMVHAIEAYTSRHKKNPLSDMTAREALRLLSANLVTACTDGTNRAAREAMALGALLAGQAFANAPVAAVHALAYPLGGRYHIPHGLSNALMLEAVLAFNMQAAEALYAELAEPVGAQVAANADDATKAKAFVARLVELMDASGAPRRLRDVGVHEDKLALLASDAMLQTRLLGNNPVALDEADALRLYQTAF